ncbi:MAG: hypothetical protein V8R75_14810 [Oscillospiraceae bacterium]
MRMFWQGELYLRAHGTPYHSGLNPTLAESGLIELARQAVRLENMTYFDKMNPQTSEPEELTIGCTCLQSGNAGWPTVPGDGTLTIDARYSNAAMAERYDQLFQNLDAFNPKVHITTEGGIEKPPFDKDLPGNRALQVLAKEVGGELGIECIQALCGAEATETLPPPLVAPRWTVWGQRAATSISLKSIST